MSGPRTDASESVIPREVVERCFIIVPAFNEASSLPALLPRLIERWPNVLVIDDGSRDATAAVATGLGAVVLRHCLNRGQGAAIQTGIEFARKSGAEYIVTFDSDGQHRIADIAAVLLPIIRNQAEIVLGSRFLGHQKSVPPLRRMILRSGVLFTRLVSNARVTDAHNGLRAFSRRAAGEINLRLDRMAHASEILDQIVRSGLRYIEVPVEIVYSEYSKKKGQSGSAALRIVFDYFVGRWIR